MLSKVNVLKLYVKGYNAAQIAKELCVKTETVQKCIQRNFKHLKKKNEMAALMKKDVKKAVNYEANKCMSDKSFILKNRSIYVTKENGDIVLKKQVSKNVTWDTPRRLTNENKYKQKKYNNLDISEFILYGH